jgi:flavorubredoxin
MDIPIRFLETERVAPDTYVIRQLLGEGIGPVAHYLNSAVITGAEPVIVDTGVSLTRDGWLDRAFALVDPADVRWIYISHDDNDHIGNLAEVLERCPQATVVTTMFAAQRMTPEVALPLDRVRLVNDGESWLAGDRELVAVTPPTFDSPTTRGLYDTRSGVYWASDSFAAAVPHPVDDVGDLDPGFFAETLTATNSMLSPWHQWLDPQRYGAHLDRIAELDARVVASAHGPTLRGTQVDIALQLLATLPDRAPARDLVQADLEQMLTAIAAMPVPLREAPAAHAA